jgi:hypothetical protein
MICFNTEPYNPNETTAHNTYIRDWITIKTLICNGSAFIVLCHWSKEVDSPILWCSHTCNHLQKELAKFGYRSRLKLKLLRILPYFLRPCGTYCLNMAISTKKKNLTTQVHFFHKMFLYELHWIFFLQKNCPKEKERLLMSPLI